ncbi:MAG: methyltransferase domain-containing protein [Candidatus Absconditicoccaceae bacterium]
MISKKNNKNDKINLFEDYFKNHDGYALFNIDFKKRDLILKKQIGKFINNFSRNAKILEIGVGQGKFTYYCKNKGFVNFTGLELDNNIIDQHKKQFKGYNFYNIEGSEFLENTKEKYDIIFMDNVFEHLTLEEGIYIAKLINKKLNVGGIWINIMPNAESLFGACALRYCDITHKNLYTSNSFSQLLQIAGFKNEKIKHFNNMDNPNIIKLIIFKIITGFFGILGMLPKIHTWAIKSIIYK